MKSCNLFLVSLEEGSTGWPGFPGRLNIPTFFFNFFWRFSFSFLICKDSLFQKATFCRPAVMSHILPVHLVLPVILCKPDFRDYLSLQVYSISCLCGSFWWFVVHQIRSWTKRSASVLLLLSLPFIFWSVRRNPPPIDWKQASWGLIRSYSLMLWRSPVCSKHSLMDSSHSWSLTYSFEEARKREPFVLLRVCLACKSGSGHLSLLNSPFVVKYLDAALQEPGLVSLTVQPVL